MNFTAIDFETATGSRNSACALAIVTVNDGVITEQYETLIQPPDNYFWRRFTEIHGISWRDTLNAPTFAALYPEIRNRLRGRILVAHNIDFDRDVLQKTMAHYRLDYTDLQIPYWQCTLAIYRAKGFKPATLDACCDRLSIPLNHHNALSDALACAELYLRKDQPTPLT